MLSVYLMGMFATLLISFLRDYIMENKVHDYLSRGIAYSIVSILWPLFWLLVIVSNVKDLLEKR